MVRLLETLPYLRKSLSEMDKSMIISNEKVFRFWESITLDIQLSDCERYVHDVIVQPNHIV